ncbi:MAG: carboxypeptidase regulatory-like domain-containing protein [Armatimonadetes bacterium]|nr:carboxypeptidase regulatory-like domain-containing protein [Armatimonadota bacterium]
MFLRRIFKGMPDLGPWVSMAELFAALATVIATLMALKVVPSPFKSPTGTVSGIVTDLKTGRAVPEATVQIINSSSRVITAESIPDAKGNWKETVEPGGYTVKAVCDGYHPAQKSVTVAQDKCRIVSLAIAKAQAEMAAGHGGAASYGAPTGPTPRQVIVVGGPSHAPSGAARTVAAPASSERASASATKSNEQLAREEYAKGKKLSNQGKYTEAINAFSNAVTLDPADGEYYACIIKVDLEMENLADAKEWAADGKKTATKNLDKLNQAAALLQ